MCAGRAKGCFQSAGHSETQQLSSCRLEWHATKRTPWEGTPLMPTKGSCFPSDMLAIVLFAGSAFMLAEEDASIGLAQKFSAAEHHV